MTGTFIGALLIRPTRIFSPPAVTNQNVRRATSALSAYHIAPLLLEKIFHASMRHIVAPGDALLLYDEHGHRGVAGVGSKYTHRPRRLPLYPLEERVHINPRLKIVPPQKNELFNPV